MSQFSSGSISRRVVVLVLAFLVSLSVIPSAFAQLSRGAITGTVVDSQGAAIAGVKVAITNQDTGIGQTAITNEVGVYRVGALDAGTYAVDFTKDGFQTQKVGSVDITAARDANVSAQLKVGASSTQVFVTLPGLELDKFTATIRTTLPAKVLDEIPMGTSSLVPAGSRNFARYALFAPGVVRVLFQNETSANGHRGRENNYMLDGTDNNDQTVTLPALFTPPEAIREVDIQAASFTAEYGRNLGAQVNVITRSGTNAYRGELWEFYRGNELEPLSLSSRIVGQKTSPRLVDNQFGGSFAGPIFKNKTFIFGMLQGNLLRTGPRPMSTVTIPTPTGYATLQSVPLRSTPTPQSTASRQAILQAMSFLPEIYPTIKNYNTTSIVQVNGVDVQMGSFIPVIPTSQNIWYNAIRLDHQLTSNDRLTYRGHIDHRVSPLSGGNLAFGERWAADNKYLGQNHFLSYTKNIGSNFLNEARVSYARLLPASQERDTVSPTINLQSLFQIGGNSSFPNERLEQTYQFQNVSTYSISRHSLKFGLDLARTKFNSNVAADSKGRWTFPNLQSFLNNQPTNLNFLGAAASRYGFHQLRQAYFFQDDIKLSKHLTTNIGLRYETSAVPLGFLGATTDDVRNVLVPGPVQRDKNNWGPRVGFAYSPDVESGLVGKLLGSGKTSIRGGFGMGYDVLFYSLLGNIATNYPRNDPQSIANPTDVFPVLPPKVSSPTLSPTALFVNVPSDAQNPTTQYWTFSVQRQIASDYIVELGYSGNRSYHLIRQGQANPGVLSAAKAAAVIAGCTATNTGSCGDPAGFPTSPSRLYPNLGQRILLETTGRGAYDGMYVQFTARTDFGLRFGANYTWSANFSDSEEFSNDAGTPGASDGGLAGSSPQVPQDFFNMRSEWARSVFDRPQRATFHYNYEIPRLKTSSRVVNQIFGGWQWSGFAELQSGQPFTLKLGVDALGNGSAAAARPDANPGGIITKDPVTGNLRTFKIPLDGTGIVTAPHVTSSTGVVTFLKNSMPTGGNLGRNTLRGPGFANFNMSLMKRFNVFGERQLQFRGDFINVFNHDNFPNPENNMSSVNFGKQVWTPLTDARQVLLGVKLAF